MRYATVAPNGKVLGIFTCDPELLNLRPKPADAVFMECPDGAMPNILWNGEAFVERSEGDVTHTVTGSTLEIVNLPADSIVSITGLTMQRYTATDTLSITIEAGAYIVEIDPWPYAKTSFSIYISG